MSRVQLSLKVKLSLLITSLVVLTVLVKEAMNDRDVAYVVFVDDDGNVRAHSDVASMGRPLLRPAGLLKLDDTPLVQTYKTDAGQVIDFAVPLVFSKVPVGA